MPNKRKPGRPRKSEAPTKRDIGRPEWCDEGMRRLAAAIVMGAVKDYRKAAKALKSLRWKADQRLIKKDKKYRWKEEALLADMESAKRFFRSERCARLSPLDPDAVIERLEREFEEYDPGAPRKPKAVIKEVKRHGRKRVSA